jgi:uncharacterized membrane protein YqjE
MNTATDTVKPIAGAARRLARRLLATGENRLELLAVEVQEERDRLLHGVLLAFGVAVLGLLAGLAITTAAVILLWAYCPVTVLLTLASLYTATGICLCWRLAVLLRDRETLSATRAQLRKDRLCLEAILA